MCVIGPMPKHLIVNNNIYILHQIIDLSEDPCNGDKVHYIIPWINHVFVQLSLDKQGVKGDQW